MEAELAALTMALGNKKEADAINGEMTRAADLFKDEFEEIQQKNASRLYALEQVFQFFLLTQSMLQVLTPL